MFLYSSKRFPSAQGTFQIPLQASLHEIIEAIKGYNIETDQSKNTDYEELMNPQNHVERVVLNESNIFAYLESLGYDSSKLVKRSDN